MTKRIKYYLLLILTIFLFQPNDVFAGTLSIWASASNITVGKTVTISVSANNLAGTFNITSSDQGVLAGGQSGTWLENDTYTFQFTAKNTGKATITVTSVDVADFDSNGSFSASKSVTLNVVAKNTSSGGSSSGGTVSEKKEYSSDNTLSSLGVEGYTLTPEFHKDTTEYKLAVDESIEKINVVAASNHNKASISGAGEVSLSSGENTIEVRVTAENGNEKVYKIIVTVEDQNPISVKVDKEEYTIVKKNNNLIEKLEYYEEKTIKIDNQDVIAYVNPTTKVTLVLLKNKDNKVGYYIYSEKTKAYQKYRYITVNGVTLQLLDTNPKLENYQKYSLELQEQQINIYKIKKSHKVGLIYGTNVKTGNTSYYVYDESEGTLSKYFDDEVEIYQEEVETLKSYLMIFMGAVSFVVIVIIIISLVRSKKKKKKRHTY